MRYIPLRFFPSFKLILSLDRIAEKPRTNSSGIDNVGNLPIFCNAWSAAVQREIGGDALPVVPPPPIGDRLVALRSIPRGVRTSNHDRWWDRRERWVGRTECLTCNQLSEPWWVEQEQEFNESEMALSSESTDRYALKVLDTADIARDVVP